jgi:hypothetical protein
MTEDDPTPALLLGNASFGGPAGAGEFQYWEFQTLESRYSLVESYDPHCTRSVSVGLWHALYYIRNFRYPPFAVAYAHSAQLHVQGEAVTYAATRLVLRLSPGIAQILVSVALSRPQSRA